MTLTAKDFHDRAMDLAFFAQRETRRANADRAQDLHQQSLTMELAAIALLDNARGAGAATLYRSAGWLALRAGDPGLATSLAERGMKTSPPKDIAREFEDLLQAAAREPAAP